MASRTALAAGSLVSGVLIGILGYAAYRGDLQRASPGAPGPSESATRPVAAAPAAREALPDHSMSAGVDPALAADIWTKLHGTWLVDFSSAVPDLYATYHVPRGGGRLAAAVSDDGGATWGCHHAAQAIVLSVTAATSATSFSLRSTWTEASCAGTAFAKKPGEIEFSTWTQDNADPSKYNIRFGRGGTAITATKCSDDFDATNACGKSGFEKPARLQRG